LIRLALANVTWSAQEVAAFVYKTAGTVALRAGALQRLFRDMNAGTQHITSAPGVIRAAGSELAGPRWKVRRQLRRLRVRLGVIARLETEQRRLLEERRQLLGQVESILKDLARIEGL
jgi:hypothetical protein